jgi:Holliday junction resolvase RusA-like endonuclease
MAQTETTIEQLHIWTNPDFNEVVIFYGLHAISFRDRRKAKELFNLIKPQLQRIECGNWPYSKPIMITIGIAGPNKIYARRDVDNMCKVILDAGNKVIYDDDRLIHILIVQKQLWELPLYGFQIGVRVVDTDKKDKYSPIMCFTSDTVYNINGNDITAPIIFHFENESDKEYIRLQSKKKSLSI